MPGGSRCLIERSDPDPKRAASICQLVPSYILIHTSNFAKWYVLESPFMNIKDAFVNPLLKLIMVTVGLWRVCSGRAAFAGTGFKGLNGLDLEKC